MYILRDQASRVLEFGRPSVSTTDSLTGPAALDLVEQQVGLDLELGCGTDIVLDDLVGQTHHFLEVLKGNAAVGHAEVGGIVTDGLLDLLEDHALGDLSLEVVDGLLADRELALRSAKSEASEFFDQLSKDRSVYYRMAMMDKTPSKVDFNARYCYFRAFTNMREVGRSLQSLAKQSLEHVANRHRVFKGDLADELRALTAELRRISSSVDGKPDLEELHLNAKAAIDRIDAMQSELMRAIPDGELSIRGSELYLTFLLFARDFINHYEIVSMLAARIDSLEQTPSVVTAPKEKIS